MKEETDEEYTEVESMPSSCERCRRTENGGRRWKDLQQTTVRLQQLGKGGGLGWITSKDAPDGVKHRCSGRWRWRWKASKAFESSLK